MRKERKSNLILYIGGLPKHATQATVSAYLSQFGFGYTLKLAMRNRSLGLCRGFGTVFCKTKKCYLQLLQNDHFLYDRRIIIE